VIAVTLEDAPGAEPASADEVLALDLALDALARVSPRQAQVVESRFFGGLDVAETAALLGTSEATVLRDWRAARAWLAGELRRKH
jgi:DNA-directed RNA polymerase specialized sigma24 family protein